MIKLKRNEWLFYPFFIIMTVLKMLSVDENNIIFKVFIIFSFIMFFIQCIFIKYKLSEFIKIIILLCISFLVYITCKKEVVLLSTFTIILCKGINYKKLFKYVLIIQSITFVTIISLSLFGFRENKLFTHIRIDNIINRYDLGFGHPNTLHLYFCLIACMYIYIYYNRISIFHLSIIFVLNLILYKISGSRTGFINIIFLLAVTFIFKKYFNRLRKKRFVLTLLMPSCALFSVMTAIFYGKYKILNTIDILLQGRVNYSKYFLDNYSMSLFGNEIVYNTYHIIDSSYILLLVNYGIIMFTVFLIGYYLLIKKMIREERQEEIILILLFSIYGITEFFLPNIFINLSLIFMSELIYTNYKKNIN